MGKSKTKRKGRSVRKNEQVKEESETLVQAPHSFIIHRGLPGGHILEITKDFRKVMEPFTATNLKERKKNTLKDFVSISGVLHISHMCIFTRTELGMYLKIGKTPRGPTLTFKVHSFSLARDVVSSLKKQFVYSECFKHSPLVVLNSFSGEGMHMKLMASTFQNMFPTINLTNINLNTIRRCVLLNYNPTSKLIDFRHYAIKAVPVGLSKGVKKVVQGKVPNLAKCDDIADFLTRAALLSESEAEDDPSSHVTLAQKLSSRGNMENLQSAIRLCELGPRLTIQLMKVEDGLLDGEVLFHELIHKTDEEIDAIKKKRDDKRKLKEKRKKQQELNTKTKVDKKEELKQKSLDGMNKKKRTESDILMRKAAREANADVQVEDDDDVEYYRQEVGEEPAKELFSSHLNRKRTLPSSSGSTGYSKKPRFDDSKDGNKTKSFGNNNKFRNKEDAGGGKKSRFNESKDGQKKPFGNNKFRKRDDSGGKKWPGGRGGNPKYGLKAKTDESGGETSNFNKSKPKFNSKDKRRPTTGRGARSKPRPSNNKHGNRNKKR